MDQKEFKERSVKLEEIGKVIDKLPPEIRAAAFEVVKGYAHGDHVEEEATKRASTTTEVDDGEFFVKFNHDKPSDNAMLIAADFYRQYGTAAYTMEEVKKVAAQVGLTIPERVDMTFRAAQEDGKKLFTSAGRGLYRPTVHGEAYLKTTHSVAKGNKPKAGVSD